MERYTGSGAFPRGPETKGPAFPPGLVVSDGAPVIIKAVESCFPRPAYQRCLAQPRGARAQN